MQPVKPKICLKKGITAIINNGNRTSEWSPIRSVIIYE